MSRYYLKQCARHNTFQLIVIEFTSALRTDIPVCIHYGMGKCNFTL